MSATIGVDVGGSHVTALLYDGLQIVARKEVRFAPRSKSEDIVGIIKTAVEHVRPKNTDWIPTGVGMPGIVSESGVVILAPNLGLHDFDMRAALEKAGVSAWVLNDATAAALGERHARKKENIKSLFCVTIGTGIGSGIVMNDEPVFGAFGRAGEIGHMLLKPDGPRCGCGQRGCLEALASATAIAREGRKALLQKDPVLNELVQKRGIRPERLSAKTIFEAMECGSLAAQKIVEGAAFWLGRALSFVLLVLDPELIVLGGGVGRAGPDFTARIRDALSKHSVCDLARTQIVQARLGCDAGAIGAAVFAAQRRG